MNRTLAAKIVPFLLESLPDALFQQAEHYLLNNRVLLPGPSILERLYMDLRKQLADFERSI